MIARPKLACFVGATRYTIGDHPETRWLEGEQCSINRLFNSDNDCTGAIVCERRGNITGGLGQSSDSSSGLIPQRAQRR